MFKNGELISPFDDRLLGVWVVLAIVLLAIFAYLVGNCLLAVIVIVVAVLLWYVAYLKSKEVLKGGKDSGANYTRKKVTSKTKVSPYPHK